MYNKTREKHVYLSCHIVVLCNRNAAHGERESVTRTYLEKVVWLKRKIIISFKVIYSSSLI